MSAQPSLNQLRRELLRRGLPNGYVERVVGEWADHVEDQWNSHISKEADMPQTNPIESLGEEAELVESTVLRFRSRTFAGRHPIWTFLVAPIPLLLACWIVFYAGLAAVMALVDKDALRTASPTAHGMTQFILQAALYLPPVAATLVLAWLAARSGQRQRWLAAACVLVALFAAGHHTNFALPIGRGQGQLMIGLGLGRGMSFVNAVAPLLIGALAIWRMGQRTTPDGTSPESSPGEPLRQAA